MDRMANWCTGGCWFTLAIFIKVVTELSGPILPFLEMLKVLEHWGEACPALRFNGLMKWEAHAMPITYKEPTILHSTFFLIS
jgi:hypothetical protein